MLQAFACPDRGVSRIFVRSLVVGVLSVAGLLGGVIPTLRPAPWGQFPEVTTANRAQSQAIANITNSELQNYARSLLAIEPIRQAAYDDIKRILGSSQVPAIACHRPNSLNALNPNIRQIAINYCRRAIEIVEDNNLTINRFNTITVAVQENSNLAPIIQQELIRLQQSEQR